MNTIDRKKSISVGFKRIVKGISLIYVIARNIKMKKAKVTVE